jgi:hypothetical protein
MRWFLTHRRGVNPAHHPHLIPTHDTQRLPRQLLPQERRVVAGAHQVGFGAGPVPTHPGLWLVPLRSSLKHMDRSAMGKHVLHLQWQCCVVYVPAKMNVSQVDVASCPFLQLQGGRQCGGLFMFGRRVPERATQRRVECAGLLPSGEVVVRKTDHLISPSLSAWRSREARIASTCVVSVISQPARCRSYRSLNRAHRHRKHTPRWMRPPPRRH